MDINILQEMWTDYDKKLSENTRINKEILKQILISKPEKRFSKLVFKAGLEVVGSIVFLIYFFIRYVSFQPTVTFFCGMAVFTITMGIPLAGFIRYFFMLYRMSFTDSVLELRRKMNESKKFRGVIVRNANLLTPFLLISAWFILSPDFTSAIIHSLRIISEPIGYIPGIIAIVFIFGKRILDKRMIRDRYKKIDQELAEIEELEKD